MKNRKLKFRKKQILMLLLLFAVMIIIAVFFYVEDYYHADVAVSAVLRTDEAVIVQQEKGRILFMPKEPADTGFIFYPGGKVEYTAYAPLMKKLSEEGILCVLLKMPFNLAVLDSNGAEGITGEFADVEKWFIGGHSLGGSMAAAYTFRHPEELEGLVLLAAYSTENLSNLNIRVLSVYGSEDGVLNMEKYKEYRENFPSETEELVIDGGNHAGFGCYGEQKWDGTKKITDEEQILQTAEAVSEFMLKR